MRLRVAITLALLTIALGALGADVRAPTADAGRAPDPDVTPAPPPGPPPGADPDAEVIANLELLQALELLDSFWWIVELYAVEEPEPEPEPVPVPVPAPAPSPAPPPVRAPSAPEKAP